jgi:hypothetical protein
LVQLGLSVEQEVTPPELPVDIWTLKILQFEFELLSYFIFINMPDETKGFPINFCTY